MEVLTALGLLFAGAFLGFLLAALCQAGPRADRESMLAEATDLLRCVTEYAKLAAGVESTPERIDYWHRWYALARSLLRECDQTPTPETAKS